MRQASRTTSGRSSASATAPSSAVESAFGAERTFFLTNGATQGNHALCLALAVDYTLFILSRYREERRAGQSTMTSPGGGSVIL